MPLYVPLQQIPLAQGSRDTALEEGFTADATHALSSETSPEVAPAVDVSALNDEGSAKGPTTVAAQYEEHAPPDIDAAEVTKFERPAEQGARTTSEVPPDVHSGESAAAPAAPLADRSSRSRRAKITERIPESDAVPLPARQRPSVHEDARGTEPAEPMESGQVFAAPVVEHGNEWAPEQELSEASEGMRSANTEDSHRKSSVVEDIRRAKTRTETPPATSRQADPTLAAELFAPQDTDRSPQAWAARLAAQATVTVNAGPDVSAGENLKSVLPAISHLAKDAGPRTTSPIDPPAPVLLPEPTRRFLRPLVGFDPAEVRVYQGETAREITQVLAADAITVGGDIVLGGNTAEDTPEALGLLAHELTHVARQQAPRFIPPVARLKPGSSNFQRAIYQSPVDEEAVALQVEARVRQEARSSPSAPREAIRKSEEQKRTPYPTVPTAAAAPTDAAEPHDRVQALPASPPPSVWAGVPAPWEPLPAWLDATPASETGVTQSPTVSVPVAAPLQPAASIGTPLLQRAAQERVVEELPAEAEGAAPASTPAPMPPADLDSLSKQVYAVLKRRLAAERRREG